MTLSFIVGLNAVVHVPVSLHSGWETCDMCPWLLNPNPNILIVVLPKTSMEKSLRGLGEPITRGGLVSSPSRLWLLQLPSQPATGKGWVQRYSSNPVLTLSCTLYSQLQGKTFLFWAALSFWTLGAGKYDWGEAVKQTCKWQVLVLFFQLTSPSSKTKQTPLLSFK